MSDTEKERAVIIDLFQRWQNAPKFLREKTWEDYVHARDLFLEKHKDRYPKLTLKDIMESFQSRPFDS